MLNTNKEWPDWCDVGKHINIVFEDGTKISGELTADNWYDIPMFAVKNGNGEVNVCFEDVKTWETQ
jgi:hypothetical protein